MSDNPKPKQICSVCNLDCANDRPNKIHTFSEHVAPHLKASMQDIAAQGLINDLEGKNISKITSTPLLDRMRAANRLMSTKRT